MSPGKVNEADRRSCTPRVEELATPKPIHSVWITQSSLPMRWGTQTPIKPLNRSALSATATTRVEELSKPKKDFQDGTVYKNRPLFSHSCGRPSMIWEVSPGAKEAKPTARIEVLSKHKETLPEYEQHKDRPLGLLDLGTPYTIWTVSDAAKNAPERPHTISLSKHKLYHKEFLPQRPIEKEVPRPSEAARKGNCSPRVEDLAMPKKKDEGPFRSPYWTVSRTALNATPTNRLMELAQFKSVPDVYQLPRNEKWRVTRGARRYVATSRINELSQPIQRLSADHLQFRNDAFVVKETALKGGISRRVLELSEPRKYN